MTAYDAYLAILRQVDERIWQALGRDKTWAEQNICPPCFYKVEDELLLKLSWLGSLDGNNSLKLVDSTFRAGHPRFDNRKASSFRWLTPSEVDKYQDEVKNAPKVPMVTSTAMAAVTQSLATPIPPMPGVSPSSAPLADLNPNTASAAPNFADIPDGPADVTPNDDPDGDIAWLNVNELNPDEVDEPQKCVNTCVECWKAAGPEARKKCSCSLQYRGFSSLGELMKYLLAIVAKILDRYGKDAGIRYDIMCAFFKTLLRSSLGRKTVALQMRGIVPAFHGHTHNRMCQLGWHPMYVEGAGLEDFEECERTFCLSNNLASCTRLLTPFHRQQQIDEHFQFHDADKHAASGNFIFQNYCQAVEKITANKLHLQILQDQLHTTAADYEKDLNDERQYLEALLKEPPDVQNSVDYMELLGKLQSPTDASQAAEKEFKNLDLVASCRGRGRAFEEEHGYEQRWTSSSKEYNDALFLTTEHRYRRAIDKLERLVVQWLLELTKLSMSGVAYKLRKKIGKALKTRAEAIHKALNEYNASAAALNPPHDQLIWVEVIQTVTLTEFDLLRDTRADICRLPWTQPACREAGLLYFGIKGAHDEHADYYSAIVANYISLPDLARELSDRWQYNVRINTAIVERLVQTSKLLEFSGSLLPGDCLGCDPMLNMECPLPPWAAKTLGLQQVVVEYAEEEEIVDTPRNLKDWTRITWNG
ncbi:hypothetical protein C8J57DRAFT_1508628 [Mycena rebaudengoi]|nr:hypothetical protein C8J57DRAFT_1508628 [Mycena rebaudengoi]